jgi:hypothetical protein
VNTKKLQTALTFVHDVDRIGRMENLEYPKLLVQLRRIEGKRLTGYFKAKGNHDLDGKQPAEPGDVNWARIVREADARLVAQDLEVLLAAMKRLDGVRRRVLIHVAFGIGMAALLSMQRFVAAIEFGFWLTASEDMLTWEWIQEQPRRAMLAEMMRTGRDDGVTMRELPTAVGDRQPLRH